MRRIKLLIYILFLLPAMTFGQQKDSVLVGQVSYISSQNIYVRFANTQNIQSGDTLFVSNDGKWVPGIKISSVSSISCVGKALNGIIFKLSDSLHARIRVDENDAANPINFPIKSDKIANLLAEEDSLENISKELSREQDINGRFRVSSYSSLSNTDTSDKEKLRYTLSLNGNNLGGSNLSAESYISFTHELGNWSYVKENVFNALKIYTLALKYDAGESTSIWFGRKINPILSNIGAVDGLMAETKFRNFSLGGVVGTRPDYLDYGLNFGLLEYGAYFGHSYNSNQGPIRSSIAFFEQRNGGNIDRRFAYFQHSSNPAKNLSLFASSELELYKMKEGVTSASPSLTSLYFSLRYRMFKKLTLSASYDTRRNVIYYETFKDYADRLLEEASRQGVRLNLNYRLARKVSIGFNGGYRYRDSDIRPTKNLNGFVNISQIPWIDASATISANYMQTSYLDGYMLRLRLNRPIIPGVLDLGLNYRYTDYKFNNSSSTLLQNTIQANLQWKVIKDLSMSFDLESTFEKSNSYYRLYLNLIKRF